MSGTRRESGTCGACVQRASGIWRGDCVSGRFMKNTQHAMRACPLGKTPFGAKAAGYRLRHVVQPEPVEICSNLSGSLQVCRIGPTLVEAGLGRSTSAQIGRSLSTIRSAQLGRLWLNCAAKFRRGPRRLQRNSHARLSGLGASSALHKACDPQISGRETHARHGSTSHTLGRTTAGAEVVAGSRWPPASDTTSPGLYRHASQAPSLKLNHKRAHKQHQPTMFVAPRQRSAHDVRRGRRRPRQVHMGCTATRMWGRASPRAEAPLARTNAAPTPFWRGVQAPLARSDAASHAVLGGRPALGAARGPGPPERRCPLSSTGPPEGSLRNATRADSRVWRGASRPPRLRRHAL